MPARSTKDLPVTLLTYGVAQCLVATPESFEGMKTLAMDAFDIGCSSANLILKTSCLDICQGSTVRIHESAWETLRLLISEIEVWTDEPPVQTDALAEDSDLAEHLSALSFHAGSAVNSDHHDEETKKTQTSRKGKSRQITVLSSSLDADAADSSPEKRDRSHDSSNHSDDDDRELVHDPEGRPSYSERQVDGSNAYVTAARTTESNTDFDGLPPTQEGTWQNQLTQSSANDEASRFVISIADFQTCQTVHFKTRGGHSVSKVVSSACQKFGLDENSAVLKLIVEVDGQDDELSVCNPADTMVKAGAQEGSKFVLEVETD